MVTGLTGMTGATVLSTVEAVNRPGHELVPILQRPLEESHVLGIVRKQEFATTNPVQVITWFFFSFYRIKWLCFFITNLLCS